MRLLKHMAALILLLLRICQGRISFIDDETYYSAYTVDASQQTLNYLTSFPVQSAVECLSRCQMDHQCLSASLDTTGLTMLCRTFSESGIEELCCTEYNNTGGCRHYLMKEDYNFLLGSLGGTSAETTTSSLCSETAYPSATDCQWYKSQNIVTCSGLYNITVNGAVRTVQCDMETDGGGWTVVFSRSADYSFNGDRTWAQYKEGFGSVTENYWLGNEIMHRLTTNRPSELYVQLTNQAGDISWARYAGFTIAPESDNYRIDFNVSSYAGTAGDGLYVGGFTSFNSHGMGFTTKDDDNDGVGSGINCAQGKGGWWWKSCGAVYLTAPAFYWGNPSFGPMQLAVMMIRYS